jgi:hypothetical protein
MVQYHSQSNRYQLFKESNPNRFQGAASSKHAKSESSRARTDVPISIPLERLHHKQSSALSQEMNQDRRFVVDESKCAKFKEAEMHH